MKVTTLRTWHAMISSFIAPMVLFFSLSGALQVFSFHENHGDYRASALMQSIGRLHKQQVFAPVPERKRPPAAAGAPRQAPRPDDKPQGATLLLKILFFWEAVALAATTLMGIWVAVTHPKYRRTASILMAAGTVLPVLLIVL